ncbi:MAG: RBBP9/YdeN family alpha/beta hydrolase [Candidatus Nanoarchaeia archaeon]
MTKVSPTNVFIIHGSYGNPRENWFPYLKQKLEKESCKVFIPKFPTPENQSLENWKTIFNKYKKHLNETTIVVGHSIGVAFLLNILEQENKKINSAFFVAGFTGSLNNKEFDKINKSFADKKFNWKKIKNNCQEFFVFHSDNDPYVPLTKAEELAKNLDVKVILVKNAGHFNESSGYKKFDLLLEKIKKQVKKCTY